MYIYAFAKLKEMDELPLIIDIMFECARRLWCCVRSSIRCFFQCARVYLQVSFSSEVYLS